MGLTEWRLNSRAGRIEAAIDDQGGREEIADQQIEPGDDQQQETDAGEHPAHQARQQQGDEEPEAEEEVAELRGAALDQLGADNEVSHQEGRPITKLATPPSQGMKCKTV